MTAEVGLADALQGRERLVASGVTVERLSALLDARAATDGGCWRLLCPPSTVEALSTRFVLGTAVAEAVANDSLAVRTTEEPAGERSVFAGTEWTGTLAGPPDDRTLLHQETPERAAGIHTAAATWFDQGTPADVKMPSRTALLSAAETALSERFADDLAVILEKADADDLLRDDQISDLTVLVALTARHDHLFRDLRAWADEVGVVAPQSFTDVRRDLADRGLVETIRVPMGLGQPKYRLRALDDEFAAVDPEGFPQHLRERFAVTDPESGAEANTGSTAADSDGPVWDRNGR
ncbi:hypothetical protein JCM17823_05490 [Halorubrum gandharaense]